MLFSLRLQKEYSIWELSKQTKKKLVIKLISLFKWSTSILHEMTTMIFNSYYKTCHFSRLGKNGKMKSPFCLTKFIELNLFLKGNHIIQSFFNVKKFNRPALVKSVLDKSCYTTEQPSCLLCTLPFEKS